MLEIVHSTRRSILHFLLRTVGCWDPQLHCRAYYDYDDIRAVVQRTVDVQAVLAVVGVPRVHLFNLCVPGIVSRRCVWGVGTCGTLRCVRSGCGTEHVFLL